MTANFDAQKKGSRWCNIAFLAASAWYLGMIWLMDPHSTMIDTTFKKNNFLIHIMNNFWYRSWAKILPLIFLGIRTLQSYDICWNASNYERKTHDVSHTHQHTRVGWYLVVALIASMIGDVILLKLDGEKITSTSNPHSLLQGTLAFLMAHMFYLMAHVPHVNHWMHYIRSRNGILKAVIIGLVISTFSYNIIWSQWSIQLKIFTLIYELVLALLTWVTSLRIDTFPTSFSVLRPFIGCLIFMYSDSLLVLSLLYEKSAQTDRIITTFIMGTYYLAQSLLQVIPKDTITAITDATASDINGIPASTPRKSIIEHSTSRTLSTSKSSPTLFVSRINTLKYKKQE
jgi:uncharacterized membrane protein YhhN